MSDKPSVLFVCVHNAGRSQMAAAWLSHLAGDRVEVRSAGSDPGDQVNPAAVEAMREVGIDISGQRSETLEPYLGEPFDWLVTVCDDAREACPTLPGVRRQEHWSVADPSAVAGDGRMDAFRRARDDLAERVRTFIERR